MNYIHRTTTIVAVTGVIAALTASVSVKAAYADEGLSCQELIKDCFVSATEQRDACLQTVATHESCSTSDIGALVKKRAQFSGSTQIPAEQGPSFLGPQIVDKRCVSNFDTAWSAALVKGPISKERVTSLSSALDECVASDVQSIPHA